MNSKPLASAVIRCLSMIVCLACAACGDRAADAKAEQEAIRQQIAKYTAAVEAADASLGAQVWRTTPDVSFIFPAGHGHGWEEVKGFYKFFGTNFSDRKFAARDIVVHVNGDTAWAEFYWHFKAKQVKDGSTAETDGRESQVYVKQDGRWQLVQAHYSSPVASQ